jgi:hypothetical protein
MPTSPKSNKPPRVKDKSSEALPKVEDAPASPPMFFSRWLNASDTVLVQTPTTYPQKEIRDVGLSLSKLSKHFIILLFIIGLAVAMHFLLKNVFGDPKFFDLIPVRWVLDLGDIAIIFAFVIIVIRELWKVEDNKDIVVIRPRWQVEDNEPEKKA